MGLFGSDKCHAHGRVGCTACSVRDQTQVMAHTTVESAKHQAQATRAAGTEQATATRQAAEYVARANAQATAAHIQAQQRIAAAQISAQQQLAADQRQYEQAMARRAQQDRERMLTFRARRVAELNAAGQPVDDLLIEHEYNVWKAEQEALLAAKLQSHRAEYDRLHAEQGRLINQALKDVEIDEASFRLGLQQYVEVREHTASPAWGAVAAGLGLVGLLAAAQQGAPHLLILAVILGVTTVLGRVLMRRQARVVPPEILTTQNPVMFATKALPIALGAAAGVSLLSGSVFPAIMLGGAAAAGIRFRNDPRMCSYDLDAQNHAEGQALDARRAEIKQSLATWKQWDFAAYLQSQGYQISPY